jgi:hypothetical protein
MHRQLVIGLVTASVVVTAWGAEAQTTSAVAAGVQFDFSLPGARSLGMGGAFASVADDATGALANPAGLTVLARPEISIEGRAWNFFTKGVVSGHIPGQASGIGVDTMTGVVDDEVTNSRFGVGFLSFVYPMDEWVFAGYRQQLVKLTNSFRSEGLFSTGDDGLIARVSPGEFEYNLDISGYGFAVGRELGGSVAIGASLNIYDLSLDVTQASYVVAPAGSAGVSLEEAAGLTGIGEKFGPVDFSPSNAFFQLAQRGEDIGWGINAGLLWTINQNWSLGTSFRQGGEFEFDSTWATGPAHPSIPSRLIQQSNDILFNVPDTFSLGVSYRPIDVFLVSVQYDRVQYSQLLNGDGDGRPVETTGKFTTATDEFGLREGEALVNGFSREDANQVRFGGEWAALRAPVAVFVRLGGWYDPNHALTFTNPDPSFARPILVATEAAGRPGPDEWHFSAGAGVSFSSFQVDGAFDLSDRFNTFSLSSVFYF